METSAIIGCFFCNTAIEKTDLDSSLKYVYDCNCCKYVAITNLAVLSEYKPKYNSEGYKISYYLRNRFENGQEPITINNRNIGEIIKDFSSTTVSHKIDKFLLYCSKKSNYAGAQFKINYMYDYSTIGCKNSAEFLFILRQMEGKNLLRINKSTGSNYVWEISLMLEAWDQINEIEKRKIDSNQAFVAMRFHDSTNSIYTNAIKPAIEESKYFPFRIDSKQHNNKICDEIIIEIRRSKFLIADVTELRGGIYFEAGYAMGLGMPVIWTCREDKIDDVHFDTRQYNHIVWKDEKDLYIQLKNRIQATIFVT